MSSYLTCTSSLLFAFNTFLYAYSNYSSFPGVKSCGFSIPFGVGQDGVGPPGVVSWWPPELNIGSSGIELD